MKREPVYMARVGNDRYQTYLEVSRNGLNWQSILIHDPDVQIPQIIEALKDYHERDFKVGDDVRLNPKAESPLGKRVATIETLLTNVEGGVFLNQELNGCRYWNVDDLILVKSVEEKENEA